MSHHHPDPETVEISAEEFTELEERIKASSLSEADSTLIIKSLQFMFWLQKSLEHAKLSIKKLQRLFGFSSKPKKQSDAPLADNNEKISDNASAPVNSAENDELDTKKIEVTDKSGISDIQNSEADVKKTKTGGRIPHTAYLNAVDHWIKHSALKSGDYCPTDCGGKLYEPKPCVILKIEGQSFAKEVRYYIQVLRCALCGDRYHAEHSIPKGKYAPSFVSQLMMHKYFLAMPFFRLESYQGLVA